jgi:hypothetical protein
MNRNVEDSELTPSSRKPSPTVGWDPYEVWRTRVRVQRMEKIGAAIPRGQDDAQAGQPDHQKHGDYNAITDGLEFAELLTTRLGDVSRDKHLTVRFVPTRQWPSSPKPMP